MMFELGLMGFALLVMGLVILPVRSSKKLSWIVGLGSLLLMSVCYLQFGNAVKWRAHFEQQLKLAKAKQVLKSYKNPDEVIQALKLRLDHTPKSAHGWYLLGRIYASQNRWQLASESFKDAHDLNPGKQAYFVHYVIALWQINQHMTPQARRLFIQILSENPNQPDALMFLAMDAYLRHENKLAISYWTRLLALTPADSEEAKMIKKSIEKARGERSSSL
jgi:cytochrome c-type biogenesis protein CcmH